LMQHLANHSTYHRGQVALMMRQLHAEPLATDFHVFLVVRLKLKANPDTVTALKRRLASQELPQ